MSDEGWRGVVVVVVFSGFEVKATYPLIPSIQSRKHPFPSPNMQWQEMLS